MRNRSKRVRPVIALGVVVISTAVAGCTSRTTSASAPGAGSRQIGAAVTICNTSAVAFADKYGTVQKVSVAVSTTQGLIDVWSNEQMGSSPAEATAPNVADINPQKPLTYCELDGSYPQFEPPLAPPLGGASADPTVSSAVSNVLLVTVDASGNATLVGGGVRPSAATSEIPPAAVPSVSK
jgi:hypothetical protein